MEPLIQGYLEGSLSDTEAARLLEGLREHPESIEAIIDQLRMEALIRDHVREEERSELNLVPKAPVSPPTTEPSHRTAIPAATPGDRRWGIQAGMAVSLGIALVLAVFLLQPQAPTFVRLSNPDQIVIERNAKKIPASEIESLKSGDRILTGNESEGVIGFAGELTEVTLPPNSTLEIISWKRQKTFQLTAGRVLARVAPQDTGHPLRIFTRTTEIEVLGTEFGLSVLENETRLEVWSGQVRMTDAETMASLNVPAGSTGVASKEGLDLQLTVSSYPPGKPGSIDHEFWLYLPGTAVTNLTRSPRFGEAPDGRESLRQLEINPNWGVLHGSRIHGWLYPPASGDYTFWLAADDAAELRISTTESPAHAVPVAHVNSPVRFREFDRHPSQESKTVTLKSGHRYYLEILYKQGMSPGGLSVAWQPPEEPRAILDAAHLAPFRDHQPEAVE